MLDLQMVGRDVVMGFFLVCLFVWNGLFVVEVFIVGIVQMVVVNYQYGYGQNKVGQGDGKYVLFVYFFEVDDQIMCQCDDVDI